MIGTMEDVYQAKRVEAATLIAKLVLLIDANNDTNRATRNWGDVGDMERVLSAVQVAVDVLEVV